MSRSKQLLFLSCIIFTQHVLAESGACPTKPWRSRGTPCSDALNTALTEVNEIINQLASPGTTCAATPISQVDFDLSQTYTIANPGNYCLTENCTGTIIITASNVTLDLNNFDLQTTTVVNALQIYGDYVSVKNGSITANVTTDTPIIYPIVVVFVLGSNYCHLSDVTISLYANGIDSVSLSGLLLVKSSQNVIVERALIYSNVNTAIALNILSTLNVFVLDSIINSSQSIINSCTNILVDGCSFKNATAHGQSSGYGLKFYDCINLTLTNSNVLNNAGCGFALSGGVTNFEIINCNAISNGFDGINIDETCNYGTIDSCNALSNGGNGFNVSSAGNAIIVQNCDANNNNGFGFKSGNSSVRFWNNAAINNHLGGPDYNIASGDPVLLIGDTHFAAGYNVAGMI